ncbi:hypothetical protein HOY80DRAFT_867574, partial [Tuber brumale]
LWHQRLAHLNYSAMEKLGITCELPEAPCATCILAKQHRTKSQIPSPRESCPFSLIHSDTCGPLPPSHSGVKYYLIFVDDFT